MMKGNISIESLLEVTRQQNVEDSHDDQEGSNVTSQLAQTLKFNGDYLTSNGVQAAISETFKQLKEHGSNTNSLQEPDQVCYKMTLYSITKSRYCRY